MKQFALLAQIPQLTFKPLRDLVGCCELGLEGVIDKRLHQMIDHCSRNFWIAVGEIHFQQTRTGSDLYLQIFSESFGNPCPPGGRILQAGMRRISWAPRTYQPHHPADKVEVGLKILVLFQVEILHHLECKSF